MNDGDSFDWPALDAIPGLCRMTFSAEECDVIGLRWRERPVDAEVIRERLEPLDSLLPDEFVDFVGRFDCDTLSIGPFAFGAGDDYCRTLLWYNTRVNGRARWWGTGLRPRQLLLVATSDGFHAILNTATSIVTALPDTNPYCQKLLPIARCFSDFISIAYAALLYRIQVHNKAELVDWLTEQSGFNESEEFWQWLSS